MISVLVGVRNCKYYVMITALQNVSIDVCSGIDYISCLGSLTSEQAVCARTHVCACMKFLTMVQNCFLSLSTV
jgi:hypothetical protein